MKLRSFRPLADDDFPRPPVLPDVEDMGGLGWRFFEDPDNPDTGPTMQVSNPGYMSVDDELWVHWQDRDNPAAVRYLQEGDENLVNIRIPPAHILRQMGDTNDVVMDAWYQLRFFSGAPATSPKIPVRVKLNTPGRPAIDPEHPYENKDLPPPEVDETIELAGTTGVPVTIRKFPAGPAWLDMVEGDVVTLYWGDRQWQQPPVTADQASAQAPLTIRLTPEQLAEGGSGELRVFYGIRDVVGNWSRRSLVKAVNVIGADALPAPDVRPSDLSDGGVIDLRKERPDEFLRLRVPVYDDRANGDVVTMTWTGRKSEGPAPEPWSLTKTVSNPPPANPLSFDMPTEYAEAVGEGTATLRYTVTRHGKTEVSRQKTYTVTGGSQQKLPAPTISEADADQLDPWDTTGGAHVIVRKYAFMKPGDLILLRWHGVTAGGAPSDVLQSAQLEDEDIGNDLVFTVPSPDVDAIAGGSLSLGYAVTQEGATFESWTAEFAVNHPAWSLSPPEVPEANGNVLSPDTAATVRIGAYDGKAAGDRVTYRWVGRFASGGEETLTGYRELDAASAQKPIDFPIPADVVAGLEGGTATVSYTSESAGGRLRPSRLLQLTVAAHALRLPAPTVSEASGEWLDPQAIVGDTATAVFDTSDPRLVPLDTIRMQCHGSVDGEFTNETVIRQGASTAVVTLPKAFVERNLGGQLTIDGDVRRDGMLIGNYHGLLLNVGAGYPSELFTIDETTLGLVVGDTHLRRATGGTTPYRYHALNVAVVRVTDAAGGGIVAVAPGTTQVIAEDASTPTNYGFYTVNVTPVDVPLSIDTSTLYLTGTQTATREASGGKRPYTYVSAEPSIARVTNSSLGTIQGVGDGNTTVSVADSVGDTASYPVTVSGVIAPLVIDEGDLHLKVGGTTTRAATGGKPPLRYRSIANDVVEVTDAATGAIRARSAGSTQVVVEDSGDPRSYGFYTVHVSAVETPLYIDPSALYLTGTQPATRAASGGKPPYSYTSANTAIVRVTGASTGTVQGIAHGSSYLNWCVNLLTGSQESRKRGPFGGSSAAGRIVIAT